MKKPAIEYRLFSNRRDIDTMVEGCKLILKLTNTRPVQRTVGPKLFPNTLPGCEKYSLGSEHFCECFSRTMISASWHPTSTCRMGSKDDLMAVVDSQMRVEGVIGLRVIDASIMPEVTNGNTNAPTVMIAERGSDLIKGRALKPFRPPFRNENEVFQYEYF